MQILVCSLSSASGRKIRKLVSTHRVNELVETKSCDTIRQIINSLVSFITNLSFLSVFLQSDSR